MESININHLCICRPSVEIPRSIGSATRCTSTGNCEEKHLLAASLVVLEKVTVFHRLPVDQERPVGSARTLCNSTENDNKPIIIKYLFVLHLYGNLMC